MIRIAMRREFNAELMRCQFLLQGDTGRVQRTGMLQPFWPVQHYHDLGLFFQVSLPDSNETLCMFNRQRELTLPRLTAAFTGTSSAYV